MAGPQNFQQYNGFKVYFGSEPTKGPRVLPILFDFTLATTYPVDLLIAQTTDELEFIQSVFIDNSSNSAPLFFTVTGDTQQTIRVPAFVQGYFPVMMNNPPRFTVSCANGSANTLVMLQSFPIPQADWGDASMAFQDASNFFNTSLANGSVTNGLFSTGTITNPSNGQIVLGPIDTMGASSAAFEYVFASGTANTISFQESESANGPWGSINVQVGNFQTALVANFNSGSSTTIKFAISQRYFQIVNNSASAQVYSIAGYLRAAPFVVTLATPHTYGISSVVLPSAALANGAAATTVYSTSNYTVNVPYSIPEVTWQYSTAGTPITTATTVTIQAAGAAGVRNYCTGFYLTNNSITATEFQILDGAAIIYDGFLGANTGNLCILDDDFLVPLRGSAATALNLKIVTAGASVYASAQGYQAF